jgi:predicted permease
MRVITPGYFAALEVPVLSGRDVSDADSKDAPPAVMINRALASRYFPNENPIGRRIGWPANWSTIVGVAGDVRQSGLGADVRPEMYFPSSQGGANRSMTLVVRAGFQPESLTSAVRAVVRSVDPDQPIFGVKSMQAVVADSLSSERLNFTLMGIFSTLALVLASAGIYGVMSYLVSQRTREFGVRMALGARNEDVFSLVLRESMVITAVGIAIGIAASFGASRILSSYIPGVGPVNALLFLGVAAVLALVGLAATLVPARRAMRVDPMVALRWE